MSYINVGSSVSDRLKTLLKGQSNRAEVLFQETLRNEFVFLLVYIYFENRLSSHLILVESQNFRCCIIPREKKKKLSPPLCHCLVLRYYTCFTIETSRVPLLFVLAKTSLLLSHRCSRLSVLRGTRMTLLINSFIN